MWKSLVGNNVVKKINVERIDKKNVGTETVRGSCKKIPESYIMLS